MKYLINQDKYDTVDVTAVQNGHSGRVVRSEHLRASRSLLGWSRSRLASLSGISVSTLRRIEEDHESVSQRLMDAVIATLTLHGVVFFTTPESIVSVGRRPKSSD